MSTQQTAPIAERVSRLEGSYERIGDVVQSLESHRAETRSGFDSVRQEMNERFRSLTTVLMTGVAVLATILVGLVGALVGLYARTG